MAGLPNASYSVRLRLHLDPVDAGAIGRVTSAIGHDDGAVVAVDVVETTGDRQVVDVTANARDGDHAAALEAAVDALDGVNVHRVSDRTFLLHLKGKLEVTPTVPLRTRDDLSMAYTPGVARVCLAIAEHPEDARQLTIKGNTVAIVSDGSAVLGLGDVIVADSRGILGPAREGLEGTKAWLAEHANHTGRDGTLKDALADADVFIGVSAPDLLAPEDLAVMAADAIVFPLANPDPEVDPTGAARYATVVATGRSDYPNQINNVLAFPGVFRGALDARARFITEDMKAAAAHALARVISPEELSPTYVIPGAFDERVAPAVASAVEAVAAADAGR